MNIFIFKGLHVWQLYGLKKTKAAFNIQLVYCPNNYNSKISTTCDQLQSVTTLTNIFHTTLTSLSVKWQSQTCWQYTHFFSTSYNFYWPHVFKLYAVVCVGRCWVHCHLCGAGSPREVVRSWCSTCLEWKGRLWCDVMQHSASRYAVVDFARSRLSWPWWMSMMSMIMSCSHFSLFSKYLMSDGWNRVVGGCVSCSTSFSKKWIESSCSIDNLQVNHQTK